MRQRGFAAGAALIAPLSIVMLVLTACATTVDSDVTTVAPGQATTTVFVATGSAAELLDQLVTEATGLSEAIVENEGQRDTLGRIETLWEAARPGVEEAAPDAVADLDRTIALMRTAVERRTPADADKALNNLRPLVSALSDENGVGWIRRAPSVTCRRSVSC